MLDFKSMVGARAILDGVEMIGMMRKRQVTCSVPLNFQIYSWSDFFENFRFYPGWSLGLVVAPNPVSREVDEC